MAGLHDRSRTYHERTIHPEFFPREEPLLRKPWGARAFRGSRLRAEFFEPPPRPPREASGK